MANIKQQRDVFRRVIPLFKVHHPKGIGSSIESLFAKGYIGEGEKAKEFEKQLSLYIGNPNSVLTNSATSALTIAYRMCGLDENSEVITTPMTCLATNQPILAFKSRVIFADIDPSTGNINPDDIERKITSRTKAIVGVHWAGLPFDIDRVGRIARKYNIPIIEDASHALGSEYNGSRIGNHSDYVCFSFQAIKHLTTGDGGALFTKNYEDCLRAKKLRWYGLNRNHSGNRWEQQPIEYGYKFHMNDICAAIGLAQLNYLDSIISTHQDNYRFYNENINNRKIELLKTPVNVKSASWIYTIRLKGNRGTKAHFMEYMKNKGVETSIVHSRNDKYSIFRNNSSFNELKGMDTFEKEMVNIPVGWWLTPTDRKYIVKTINDYV
jgi:perosamine synthetase